MCYFVLQVFIFLAKKEGGTLMAQAIQEFLKEI